MSRSNWYTQHPLACTCNQCHEKRLITQEADGKIGRNQPCPCGSEKKYKKCHGR